MGEYIRGAKRIFEKYVDYAQDFWVHLTPMQYLYILISVALLGWVLMKSARNK